MPAANREDGRQVKGYILIQKALVVIAAAVLLCVLALHLKRAGAGVAYAAAEPEYDPENYLSYLEAYGMQDIYDLEQLFVDAQYAYLPIAPPTAEPFLQLSTPVYVPIYWKNFPRKFNDMLVGELIYGVPVYPVTVFEDEVTREVVFFNAEGHEMFALPPPEPYDPYAFAKDKFPKLFTDAYSEQARQRILRQYDPARMQFLVYLVLSEDLQHFLYNQSALADAAMEASLDPMGSGGGTMMMSGSEEEIEIAHMAPVAAGMELTVTYPTSDVNKVSEVFTYDDASSAGAFDATNNLWTLAETNLVFTGTTQVTWTDTNVTLSVSNRFYIIGLASADNDGDGLNNAREVLIYKTGKDNPDTDNDGLDDGEELLVYGTDPFNPDSDGDQMADGWEVEHGFDPTPIAKELIGWWPLDEGQGTSADDKSGNGHPGTVKNTNGGEWVEGVLSNALWFHQGSNLWVDMGNASSLNATGDQVTVCCWYRPNQNSAPYNQNHATKTDWDVNYSLWAGWYNWIQFKVKVNGTNYAIPSTSAMRVFAQQWSHVAAVYDGSAIRGYKDGIELAVKTNVAGQLTSNSHILRLGHNYSQYNVRGRIDDVRIYQEALSSNEIWRLTEPGRDEDNDGFTNLEEHNAGTDPNSSNPPPEIVIVYPTDGQYLP